MIATPVLPLRNRLAEMVLRALADTAARQDLARLAEPGPSVGGRVSWRPRGARALLDEGPRRLLDGDLSDLDLSRFATAVAAAALRIGETRPVTVPAFPRNRARRERSGSRAEG